jgi:hypothetical protein
MSYTDPTTIVTPTLISCRHQRPTYRHSHLAAHRRTNTGRPLPKHSGHISPPRLIDTLAATFGDVRRVDRKQGLASTNAAAEVGFVSDNIVDSQRT